MKTPKMSFRGDLDWCHFCGVRDNEGQVEIFYDENAEHPTGISKYVRVCSWCIDGLYATLRYGKSVRKVS